MACETRIPLDDVVKAIVKDYGADLAKEIMKHITIGNFVASDGGVANNLTLRGSLLADANVKRDLCSLIAECVVATNDCGNDECCEEDKHISKFYVDNNKEQIVIETIGGLRFSVSKAELEKWFSNKEDKDTKPTEVSVSGSHLSIKLSDGSSIMGDVSTLLDRPDTKPTGMALDGTNLRINLSDGSSLSLDLRTLASDNDTKPTRGAVNGNTLAINLSDGSTVNVDMETFRNDIVNHITGLGYSINTQGANYTTQASDFNGRTIIRADSSANQQITVTRPSESYIGKSLIIRKTGTSGTTTIVGSNVTINPTDISPLRRTGNTVTLVYIGGGVWDAFGELP